MLDQRRRRWADAAQMLKAVQIYKNVLCLLGSVISAYFAISCIMTVYYIHDNFILIIDYSKSCPSSKLVRP